MLYVAFTHHNCCLFTNGPYRSGALFHAYDSGIGSCGNCIDRHCLFAADLSGNPKERPGNSSRAWLTNPLQCHILFKNKIKKILRGRVTRSDENPIYGKSRPAVKPASRRQDGPDQAKRVWQVIVRSADSVSSLQFRSRQYSLDERGKQNVHDRHGICA